MGSDNDVKVLTAEEMKKAVMSASRSLEPIIDYLAAHAEGIAPLAPEDAKQCEDALRKIDSLLSDVVFSLAMPR